MLDSGDVPASAHGTDASLGVHAPSIAGRSAGGIRLMGVDVVGDSYVCHDSFLCDVTDSYV